MSKINFYFIFRSLLFPLFLLNTFMVFSQSTVIRGPYLQSGTSTSTILKWRTSNNTDSKVWYGISPDNLDQSALLSDDTRDHEVSISNLIPGTIYYYGVGASDEQMEGGDNVHYFKTAPEVGSRKPVTAWILGDCGTGTEDQENVRDAYYNYIGDKHTDMILLLGDNAYTDGTDSDYQDAIFEMYPDKLKNTMLWSCPGNHEYVDEWGLNADYYDIFTFPVDGSAGGLASNTEQYYAFDYANIHIISIDSQDEDFDTDSPMLTWLENDLGATAQEWIVVMFHHPPYSKGSHDSDTNDRMTDVREKLIPLCESYGVDLVLSGHSHSYERSKLINGHYGYSSDYNSAVHDIDGGDGRLDGNGAYQQNGMEEGTVYVVTGSAGKTNSLDEYHPVMYYALEQLGSTILEVEGDQMDVKFLNDSGVVEDYLSLRQNGSGSGNNITLDWITPFNGQVFGNLNTISLSANALADSTTISSVEFFINDNPIGTVLQAPYTIDWTPLTYDTYNLKAIATDSDGATISKEISILVQDDTLIVFDISIPIDDSDDDVEEDVSNGYVSSNSSDLELSHDGGTDQIIGLRFNNINLPQGAVISDAYIQFTVDETDNDETNLLINGQAHENAPAFSSDDFDVSSRILTSASVEWNPVAWTNNGDAGLGQQTPSLSPIVEEIINGLDWTAENSMVFTIRGMGTRIAESYNGSSDDAPTLHISFSLVHCDTFEDADNDGFCSDVDCDDSNASIYIGASCDDSDPNTINDIYNNNCVCLGEENDTIPTNIIFVEWENIFEGDSFCSLDLISLAANASGSNDAISQVEFFVNGNSVGVDLTAPYSTNWTPGNYETYILKVTATNINGESLSKEITISVQSGFSETIEIAINDRDDDVEEDVSNGNVSASSSDLELCDERGTNQIIGLRFNNITIPPGVEISNAYIQFTVDETDIDETNLSIYGQADDNAPAFSREDFDVSSRITTNTFVDWNPVEWTNTGDAGLDQQTPDLGLIIQEIIDRPGWVAENSMVFTIRGTGTRVAESYNGSSNDAPILHLSYTNACDPINNGLNSGSARNDSKEYSIRNENNKVLNLFPNPVSNYLFLEYKSSIGQTTYLELVDQKGSKVYFKNLESHKGYNTFQVDVSQFPDGLYTVRLVESEIVLTDKIIINNVKRF